MLFVYLYNIIYSSVKLCITHNYSNLRSYVFYADHVKSSELKVQKFNVDILICKAALRYKLVQLNNMNFCSNDIFTTIKIITIKKKIIKRTVKFLINK